MNNIFVGNLSFHSTKEDVQKLFEPLGTVANVVIMERKKGKSRGYGFVDMPNEDEKNKAIAALNGFGFMGRVLEVSQVIPKVKGGVNHKRRPVQDAKPSYEKFAGAPRPPRQPRSEKPGYKKFEGGTKSGYPKKSYPSDNRRDSRDVKPDSKPSFGGASKPGGYPKKFSSPSKPDPKPSYKKFDSSSKPTGYPKKDSRGPAYSTRTSQGAVGKKPAGKTKTGFKPPKSWSQKGAGRT